MIGSWPMGVNTLDTYVAWNFHQPYKDAAPDFTGWRDLARFITLAGDAGLDVIVRPGPYICAEWDNGGFPSWAISDPEMVLRSSDPLFTGAVGSWFDAADSRHRAASGLPRRPGHRRPDRK